MKFRVYMKFKKCTYTPYMKFRKYLSICITYNVYEIYFICLYDVYMQAIYTKICLEMSILYRHIDTQGWIFF